MAPATNLQASSTEQRCLALNIYHEANGSSKLDMRSVGHVSKNRQRSGKFRDTICGVVYQPGQFSWTRHKNQPGKNFDKSEKIAQNIINGSDRDPTNGALYFYDFRRVQPKWSYKMNETLRTDVHSYRKPT